MGGSQPVTWHGNYAVTMWLTIAMCARWQSAYRHYRRVNGFLKLDQPYFGR